MALHHRTFRSAALAAARRVRIAAVVVGPGVARTGLTVNGSAARSRSAVSVGDGGALSDAAGTRSGRWLL
jgi:hypothetical protein